MPAPPTPHAHWAAAGQWTRTAALGSLGNAGSQLGDCLHHFYIGVPDNVRLSKEFGGNMWKHIEKLKPPASDCRKTGGRNSAEKVKCDPRTRHSCLIWLIVSSQLNRTTVQLECVIPARDGRAMNSCAIIQSAYVTPQATDMSEPLVLNA